MTAGVAIVGAGIAGVTAAQTLRAQGYEGAVTLVGGEPGLPYRRTALSKDLLNADLRPERISLAAPESWAAKSIDVRSGVRVVDVDPAERRVSLDDGTHLDYRALLLATGGLPVRPEWLPDDVPALRTLADAEHVRTTIRDTGALVVIGGGVIGLELAASAGAAGLPVTVVEAGDRVMSRVVPTVISEWLAQVHRDHGVQILTGSPVAEASAASVHLPDGSQVGGAVVAALGIRADVATAESAAVPTSAAGLLVDSSMRTGVPGIYAAGDVAAVPDPRPSPAGGPPRPPVRGEHWFGAADQGRAAALTMLADDAGLPAPTFEEVPRAWTMQYGFNVQTVGWPSTPGGEVSVEGSLHDGDATVRVFDGGLLIGAVTVGRAAHGRALRAEIADGLGRALCAPV